MTMYTRILVPMDSSEVAEQILPYASLLAKGLEVPVELFRAIEPVSHELTDPRHGLSLDQIVTSIRVWGLEYLNKIATPLLEDGISVSCEVQQGEPASQILAEAHRDQDALIAMSTHGRSGIARWMLGSVTDKVLRATANPLLLVRSQENEADIQYRKLTTMIVPLDGSPEAEQVMPHVVTLARNLQAKVELVRVIPTGQMFYEHVNFRYEDAYTFLDQEAMEYLRKIGQGLRDQGIASVDERLLHGHLAGSIVDMAKEVEGSLVAMTTHGRSGVGRWILGSVTDQVVHHSGSPVLIIRTAYQ